MLPPNYLIRDDGFGTDEEYRARVEQIEAETQRLAEECKDTANKLNKTFTESNVTSTIFSDVNHLASEHVDKLNLIAALDSGWAGDRDDDDAFSPRVIDITRKALEAFVALRSERGSSTSPQLRITPGYDGEVDVSLVYPGGYGYDDGPVIVTFADDCMYVMEQARNNLPVAYDYDLLPRDSQSTDSECIPSPLVLADILYDAEVRALNMT